MKPVFHRSHTVIVSAAALLCLLAGCGQKGPLYLPTKPQPAASVPASAAPAQPAKPSGSTPDSK